MRCWWVSSRAISGSKGQRSLAFRLRIFLRRWAKKCRWAGSAPPRSSPIWRAFSLRTLRPTSPGPPSTWTATDLRWCDLAEPEREESEPETETGTTPNGERGVADESDRGNARGQRARLLANRAGARVGQTARGRPQG